MSSNGGGSLVPPAAMPQQHSPRIRANLGANLAGAAWSTVIGLAFVPVYLHLLGIEGYGVIGFYYLLQTVLLVFDFGVSPTVNRELARQTAAGATASETASFVWTIQIVYASIGLVLGLAIACATPFLVGRWLSGGSIPSDELKISLFMIAAIVAIQWPVNVFQAALLGLQRQVKLNVIRIAMSAFSHSGAAIVLLAFSRTIPAFFAWQIVVSAVYVAWLGSSVWRILRERPTQPTRFDSLHLRSIWRFAAGMSWIALAGIILSQTDKMILSKLLDLSAFGYYTLGATLGGGLTVLIAPVFNTFFPRLCAGVATGDIEKLQSDYHLGARLMTMAIIPPAAVIATYSHQIIGIWTGSADAAQQAGPIAAVLVIGTAVNAIMNMPYGLQLAYGKTKLAGALSLTLIVLMVPTVIILTTTYGAIGGALGWTSLNVLYLLIGVPITHLWLLRGHGLRMIFADVVPLALVSAAIAYGSTFLVSALTGRTEIVAAVGATLMLAWVAAAVAGFPGRLRRALRIARA